VSRVVKISVVVPCFNHERYVEECLASIDVQDVDDLEVIVIDDGSTDASWERIKAYRWRPGHRVRTLRTQNEGVHAALNRGMRMATGELIAICNSDDSYEPGRLLLMAEALCRRRARFGFSAVTFIGTERGGATDSEYAAGLKRKQEAISTFPSVGFALLDSNVTISSGNFVFERSLLQDVGEFRAYRHCHDWDFALRALLISEPAYVPRQLYRYRLHSTNSFRALQRAGEEEGGELLSNFFRSAVSGPSSNVLVPCPQSWPIYFERFLAAHGYGRFLPPKEAPEMRGCSSE
jgi:glycosyltransferase involved in cell wall biosynthesis